MHNPQNSLAGNNVKVLTAADRPSKPGKNTPKRSAGNPLGITVNTNLSNSPSNPPKLVYAPKSNSNAQSTPALKKKANLPQPLDLRACFSHGQSNTALRQPSSAQDAKTPIIIITPTDDSANQCHNAVPVPPVPPVRRPRIASSIYTVASPVSKDHASHAARSRARSSTTKAPGKPTPPSASVYSFKDRDLARRRSTLTALPTPTRSTGWWNVITSPFASSIFPSSLSTSDSDEASDETPLQDSAAPMGLSRDLEDEAIDDSPDTNIENSPFRHYIPPTTGEAASFYDLNIDFKTPELQSAGFQSPEIPMSARTVESTADMSPSNDREIPTVLSRHSPEVQDSAKKVPVPQMPSWPPPKSSRAAVIEDFRAQPKSIGTPKIDTTASVRETIQSPLSPSPVLETASIGTVQMARSIDAEQTRTPPQKPAFRIVTANSKSSPPNKNAPPPVAMSTVNDGYEPSGHRLGPQASSQQSNTPFVGKYEVGSAKMETSYNRDDSNPTNISKSDQLFATQTPDKSTSRHAHTYSVESDPPLIFNETEKLEAQVHPTTTVKKGSRTRRQCSKAEKIFLIGVGVVLAMIVIIAVLVCMLISRNVSEIPVAQHWLNLTGYPPLPTGVSTVTRLQTSSAISGCVSPPEMWSCTVPKEQRAPSSGEQPKFRFLILFNNNTISDKALTQPALVRRTSIFSRVASALHRTSSLKKRDSSAPMLSPYPQPPTQQDQKFLGNTTDGVAHPYFGEETPFVITFMPAASPILTNLTKRASPSEEYGVDLINDIPSPTVKSNVAAAPPQLHPYPKAQPLHLFDRGLGTEHYGFYTYFDKSIFLASTGTASVNGDGGARISEADARCTWSQTRFLVKIWTRRGSPSFAPSPDMGAKRLHVLGGVNGTVSAFDFSGSGSFPLPISIVEDRHGGESSKKALYCYGVNPEGTIVTNQRGVHREDRSFGGTPVHPAPGPFLDADVSDDGDEDGYGGIDGGTGGCSCEWTNFNAY